MFEDLYIFVHYRVAEGGGPFHASTGALPCLYAAALSANLSECGGPSGEDSGTEAGSQSAGHQEERQTHRLI
jgi:hypothetical protein